MTTTSPLLTFSVAPDPTNPDAPLTFERLLQECAELHRLKDSDYAGSEPYANFMFSYAYGQRPDRAVMTRLSDKFRRVCELLIKEQAGTEPAVTDESLEDTLRDLLNYAGIMLVLRDTLRRSDRLV